MTYAAWGTMGNAAFALPMVQQMPTIPATEGYTLAWDTVNQAIGYFPLNCNFVTGDMTLAGSFGVAVGEVFKVNGTQVLSLRDIGWVASTGTPLKTAYDTATVTLAQLAGQVMAMKTALINHGLIGA